MYEITDTLGGMVTFGCILRWYCALYHGVCTCDKEFITTGGSTKYVSGIICMICSVRGAELWPVWESVELQVLITTSVIHQGHRLVLPETVSVPLQGNTSITLHTRNKRFSLINKQPWHGAQAPTARAPVPAGRSTAEQLLWQDWDFKGQVITSLSEA